MLVTKRRMLYELTIELDDDYDYDDYDDYIWIPEAYALEYFMVCRIQGIVMRDASADKVEACAAKIMAYLREVINAD